MKTKILAGLLSLVVGFTAVSCDDEDDYSPATGKLVESVTTGSSDVTATTATLNGTVNGNITTQASGAYTVGFYYGTSESLGSTVTGSADGNNFSATIDGLTNNTTIYYQAFLTLQGTVTYKGDVKTLITTNAKVATGDASNINANDVTLAGTVTDGTSDATSGIVIAASSDVEKVRAGLILASGEAGSFTMTQKGLLPGATYYYAAYLNLGTGVIYGDVKSFTTKSYTLDASEDFVDLGLSTKWCKFNIGATQSTELGGLFAFGDLTGVNNSTDVADYSPATDIYKTDNDIVFTSLKVATIPTADEFQELFDKCEKEWTEQDGVSGYKFTGPNGNSIFLPAAGSRKGNTISNEGENGLYLTGSVNPTNTDFAISYEFSNGSYDKATQPRFMALSVRPVTVAKNVALDKSLLYKTWQFDLDAENEGAAYKFAGPLTYYGTGDSWYTVTNNEPQPAGTDSWSWGPDYAGNSWLCDLTNYGSMTFAEDGTVTIVRAVKAADGTYSLGEAETGTYTVDEVNKTITLSIDILGLGTFNEKTLDAKTNLKILSLDESGLQIAILRDPTLAAPDGACLLSYNYINGETYLREHPISVLMQIANSDWNHQAWDYKVGTLSQLDLQNNGSATTTITYKADCSGGMVVFCLDLSADFLTNYPNGMFRIDAIKADGKDVAFDANKFFYGNIEGKGKYRVEMFNAWGGTADASPFSNNTEKLGTEPAMAFSTEVEITLTAFADVQFPMTRNVNLITINSGWGGPWDHNTGQQITIDFDAEAHKFVFEPQTVSFNFSDASVDFSGGSIMTFLQVADGSKYFPTMHATLDKIALDGTELTGWDASKVLDTSDSGNYRLELWNMYGATSSAGCAFGKAESGVIKELGFKEKMELTATFQSLFAVPTFK